MANMVSMSNVATRDMGLTLPDAWSQDAPLPDQGPPWLQTLRDAATAKFNSGGLPTLRDEEWRYTNLKGLRSMPLQFRAPALTRAVDPEAFAIPDLSGPRLVFVNGRFDPRLSALDDLPVGVTVGPIAEAIERDTEGLSEHLARYADIEDPFTALNTAFLADGMYVAVPERVLVERPIRVLHVAVADGGPIAIQPRLLVVAGASSQVTVIEDFVCPADHEYLTNAVAEVVVAANADVKHYLIQRESPQAVHVSTLRVQQGRDSRFESHAVLLGGCLVRNNVNPVLAGEHCHSLLNGLYIGRGKQHLDNHMRVVHEKPNGDSRQYYRGILFDEAHGVFGGRIVVVQDAQKTDAVQSNANLLLSPNAQAQTKPQLEIYADDVKCTHGATIGALDEDAIFYLRARGLSADAAQHMLVRAFAGEGIERMTVAPVREFLDRLITERLG